MSDEATGEMPNEVPTEKEGEKTQEPRAEVVQVNAAEWERIQRALKETNKENAERRKKLEAYEKAEQERTQAAMTETERLKAENEALKKQTVELTKSEQRRSIAEKTGLPSALAIRIQGETPEEMEADAKALLEALPKAPKTPTVSPTNPGAGASQGETVAQALARVHGQNVNIFDKRFVEEHGGGVIYQEKPLIP